jgi:hypothetical protein
MPAFESSSEDVVERWMMKITVDGGVDRFDDLHIDKIDLSWKDNGLWVEGAIEAFRMAIRVRDRNHMPLSVGLGFSLVSSEAACGVNFRTKEELRAQLDWSPPSLYLIRQGDEPHTQSESANIQPLDPAILGVADSARLYYLEFRQDGASEYSRSVFIEG